MPPTLRQLGLMVQTFPIDKGLTQGQLADAISPPTNRTAIAHLGQGRRVPDADSLRRICQFLQLPDAYWDSFLDSNFRRVTDFEDDLGELVGVQLSLDNLDRTAVSTARDHILSLLDQDLTTEQTFDTFRSVLVYYGVPSLKVVSYVSTRQSHSRTQIISQTKKSE